MTTQKREEDIETFIKHEFYACQSSLVEEALRTKLFLIDDIENMYRPFDGKLLKPNLCYGCNQEAVCLDSETGECEGCFEENQTPQEIYEWWLVSPWLSKRLLLEGEPILDSNYGIWWGRCVTGQAISLDAVIQKIYNDLMTG